LAEAMPWAGLTVAGLSIISLLLYSSYHLLSNVFVGGIAPLAREALSVGLTGIGLGVAISLMGFVLVLRYAEPRSVSGQAEEDVSDTFAA
jgi:hypothetical protein